MKKKVILVFMEMLGFQFCTLCVCLEDFLVSVLLGIRVSHWWFYFVVLF